MTLNKQACIVICALLLAGCSTAPPVVQVPIAIKPPVAPVVERPHLYLLDIPTEVVDACESRQERCGELMRAWEATLESVYGWGLEQKRLLDGYR